MESVLNELRQLSLLLKRVVSIQTFINMLEESRVPKAILIRAQKGYANRRIMDTYKAMMFNVELSHIGNRTIFVVPYCDLSLRIGLGHGLSLYDIIYPDEGHFSNPENTLDKAYLAIERNKK